MQVHFTIMWVFLRKVRSLLTRWSAQQAEPGAQALLTEVTVPPAQWRARPPSTAPLCCARTRSKSVSWRHSEAWAVWGRAALPARGVLTSPWLASVPRPSRSRPCVSVTAVTSSLLGCGGSRGLGRPAVAPCLPPPSTSWGSRAAESRPGSLRSKRLSLGFCLAHVWGRPATPAARPAHPGKTGRHPRDARPLCRGARPQCRPFFTL